MKDLDLLKIYRSKNFINMVLYFVINYKTKYKMDLKNKMNTVK